MNHSNTISLSLKNISKTFKFSNDPSYTIQQKIFNLHKKKKIRQIKALNNITLEIFKGECVGVIGRNGSGKSTLVKVMSGAYIPDKNGILIKNGSTLLLNLGVGFSHELTARENIYVNGSTLGMSIKTIDRLLVKIVEFAELQEFVDTKIKFYSTGMIKRLSFSIAVHAKADIILLDEVFAVGDEKFKNKATILLEKNWIKGRTVIIVSHSIGLIKKYCSKTILMDKGKMIFYGDTQIAVEKYRKLSS